MTGFSEKILKAISDYKLILRKNLPAVQCTTRMRELGIKRKSMLGVDEVGFYKIGLKIIEDIKNNLDINGSSKSGSAYHGTKEFLQYLEDMFANYRIEGGKVVHVGQKASSILVDALQLVSLAKGEFSNDMLRKIKRYGDIITVYGNEEQKKLFLEAIGSDNY